MSGGTLSKMLICQPEMATRFLGKAPLPESPSGVWPPARTPCLRCRSTTHSMAWTVLGSLDQRNWVGSSRGVIGSPPKAQM